MASNHTSHYDLNQWAASDKVLRAEFNADNAKVDAALAGLAGQVAGKASQTDLTALTATVNTKANQAELTALTNTVSAKANQADLTALTSTVNTKANQAELTSLTATVNTKASQSEVNGLKTQMAANTQTLRGEITAGDLWVKLGSYTSTASTTNFSIDLSQITFTDYWQIRILFYSEVRANVEARLNNDSASHYSTTFMTEGSNISKTSLATFFGYSSYYPVGGELVSQVPVAGQLASFFVKVAAMCGIMRENSYVRHDTITWADLQTLNFTCTTAIPAGAKVLILGLPK